MKFIVIFSLLGIFLTSSYAGERLESEKTKETDAKTKHPNNFSVLVEATMDLMGPDTSSIQNSDQLAIKSNH